MRAVWRVALIVAFAMVLAASLVLRQAGATVLLPPIKVIATTTDIKDLVRTIGGRQVVVESLAAPSQDPHTLELKPTQLLRMRSADLVIRIGLDHEPWLARTSTDAPVLDLSRTIRLLQTDTPRLRAERQAHIHLFGNPHYWLDPNNARPMVLAITAALTRLRPAEAAYFNANQAAFLSALDAQLPQWKAALAPYAGTRVVVLHDSWTYFADCFGLSIVASAEPSPGIPPSPAELATLFSRMRAAKVRLVIANPDSNADLVRQLATHGGAPAVTLVPSVGGDPAADTYLMLIATNVSRLAKALR